MLEFLFRNSGPGSNFYEGIDLPEQISKGANINRIYTGLLSLLKRNPPKNSRALLQSFPASFLKGSGHWYSARAFDLASSFCGGGPSKAIIFAICAFAS